MIIKNMTLVLGLISSLLLFGCGEQSETGKKEIQDRPPVAINCEITNEDIAVALGMKSFRVQIVKDGYYGLTFKHAEGYEGVGFGSYKANEIVKIIYWRDGEALKYCIRRENGSYSGEISIKNPAPFRSLGGSPDVKKVFKPGEIIDKWSVNDSMTSDNIILNGEIGLMFALQDDARPIKHMNLIPAPGGILDEQGRGKF